MEIPDYPQKREIRPIKPQMQKEIVPELPKTEKPKVRLPKQEIPRMEIPQIIKPKPEIPKMRRPNPGTPKVKK